VFAYHNLNFIDIRMNRLIKTIVATLVISLSLGFLIFSPAVAFAQEGEGDVDSISALWDRVVSMFSFGLDDEIDIDDATQSKCIPWSLAKTFVNWAAILSGIVLMGYLIIGGIKYATSTGDPGKMEEAQKTIINALIGFAIVVLAWSVAGLVTWLFGVNSECVGGPSVPAAEEQTEATDKKGRGEDCSDGPECESGVCSLAITNSRLTCE